MTTSERGTLAATIIASGAVFLDGAVISVALPSIGATLPAYAVGVLEGQVYVVAGYMATLAAFLLLAGGLGDHFGMRRVFLAGLVGFGLTSLLCGLAPSLDVLAIARVLQGMTGALLVPGSLAIIAAHFDGEARARAYGVWAAVTSLVSILGLPLGGVLIEALGWRAIFVVNIPLLALGVELTRRFIPVSRPVRNGARFDVLGAVVAVAAVGGLMLGAMRGQQTGWSTGGPIVALAIGTVALVAFPILMLRRPNPLVPLDMFRNRTFAAINLSTFLIYAGLYTLIYMQSLFLQGVLGYSPLAAALIALPIGILLGGLSAWAGSTAGRVGARPFLVGGPLLLTAGALWWLRIPATSTPWLAQIDDLGSLVPPLATLTDPLPAIVLFGLGMSLIVAPLTATLMSACDVSRAGVASAINNALSRLGQPMAAAVIFILISDRFYASLADRVPGLGDSPGVRAMVQPLNAPGASVDSAVAAAARLASAEAFQTAMILIALLMLAGALVNWVGIRPSAAPAPLPRSGTRT